MELAVNITEALVGNVSVYLGGNNVLMTQKLLNGAKINTLFQ